MLYNTAKKLRPSVLLTGRPDLFRRPRPPRASCKSLTMIISATGSTEPENLVRTAGRRCIVGSDVCVFSLKGCKRGHPPLYTTWETRYNIKTNLDLSPTPHPSRPWQVQQVWK